MKTNFTTLIIAVLVIAAFTESRAQWSPVYQDNNAQFYDASFPTDYTGYVAATDTGGALVLRTNDGGATWNKRYIPGLNFINKIAMLDSLRGYLIAGGAPVKLLKTNDGFTTFTGYILDSSYDVQALCLLNDSTGFYLNNGSRLRKFENYGAAFFHVIDTLTAGQNLQFVNSTTGYLDAGNSLLKTTDAGINWNYVNPNLGFFCVALNFADSLNGYFSDFTNVLITHDGGISFSQLYNFPNTYNFATKDSFCIAANDLGNVAYTADGGLTWQTEITGINWIAPEPYKIVVTPSKHCFLFSQFCGEIRKNELSTAVKGDTYIDKPILIYPNPASAKITIEFPFTPKNGTVTFFGSTGQIAGTIVLEDDEQKVEINIQNFSPGLYLWKFMEYGNVFTGKFIIQN